MKANDVYVFKMNNIQFGWTNIYGRDPNNPEVVFIGMEYKWSDEHVYIIEFMPIHEIVLQSAINCGIMHYLKNIGANAPSQKLLERGLEKYLVKRSYFKTDLGNIMLANAQKSQNILDRRVAYLGPFNAELN